ncbi:MAG: hypothetical protein FWH14_02480 [Oscillospiraceae bacterium]|nr:hypothetical protein [Oscillospiraceae bacterium]
MFSKREKVLITIAIALALSFGSLFAAKYMFDLLDSKEEKHAIALAEKLYTETKFAIEENTRQSNQRVKDEFENLKTLYPVYVSNEISIDRVLTRLVTENGLRPTSLTMPPDPVLYNSNLNPYAPPSPPKMPNQTDNADSPKEPPATPLMTTTASMTVEGNFNSLKRLIDAVHDIDHVRITQMSFPGGMDSINVRILLDFEMTMLNPDSINDILS